MIYSTGDTHGDLDIQRVVDFFEIESLSKHLTKEDYLIILGDAGLVLEKTGFKLVVWTFSFCYGI